MKLYFVFSRTYFLILLILLLISSSLLAVTAQGSVGIMLLNEKERSEYIYKISNLDAELLDVKEVIIPTVFDENFKKYNSKVKKSGFDLTEYNGKSVALYTYVSGQKIIHLFTYNGKLICADIDALFDNTSYFERD